MMLKGSFSLLPSYKYRRFKPNFFSGTNVDKEDIKDTACLVFGSCHDHIDIHYFDATIHGEYFRQQLQLNRNTFSLLLNILRPCLARQNTHLRDCVTPEKLLALGLYRLAHGNSYITIGANFNVGKTTVIEAVQDVVEALCDLKNDWIKFPSTNREILAT